MDRKVRRRILLLSIAAGVTVGSIAAAPSVDAYRRFRDRTAIQRMTGEHWGRYRSSMLSGGRARVSRRERRSLGYDPVSFSANSVRGVGQSRAVGKVTAARLQQAQPRSTAVAGVNYSSTRGSGGVLTEKNVYAFRQEFSQSQSRQAMRAALGEPDHHYLNKDVWKIKRVGLDGKPSSEYSTLTATYDGFSLDSKTSDPPSANW